MSRILIDAPRDFDEHAAAREEIRSRVRDRVQADATIDFEPKSRSASHLLHLSVGNVVEVPGQAGPVRPTLVRLRPTDKAAGFEATGQGVAETGRVASVLEGFDDAWKAIGSQRLLARAGEKAMIKALEHSDARIRGFAIMRLGETKAKGATNALCELLKKEERPELVLRTIGALVGIGDPGTVEHLIELSHRKDPSLVVQIIFAVGAIGGDLAEAYLVTMASGHPVEAVRKAATDALAEAPKNAPAAPESPK